MTKPVVPEDLVDGPAVHPAGLCESDTVGRGTRVWAFTHVLPGAVIGQDCNLCDHVFVEGDTVLGDRVTVKSGVQLWDGLRIGDDVFIGPNATFTNDRFPRSKQYPDHFPRTVVEAGASVGANATILPGVTIGRSAMVGAGAVVTKDVPPGAVVVGNPARVVRWVDTEQVALPGATVATGAVPPMLGAPDGGSPFLHRLVSASDMRGRIAVAEAGVEVPFTPARTFLIYDVPSPQVRGEHALRTCHEFIVPAAGSAAVVVDDGRSRLEFALDDPQCGLHVPAMTWRSLYRFTPGTVLLVLASEPYDAGDYIRDYDEFLALVGSSASAAEGAEAASGAGAAEGEEGGGR